MLKVSWIGTPLRPMIALCDACSLQLLEFADQKILRSEMIKLFEYCKGTIQFGETPKTALIKSELQQYFARNLPSFTVPLALHRSEFSHAVWHALRDIPAGATSSYGDIARAFDKPSATRAVARTNGANQIVIPFHRVIGADGSLTCYGVSLWRKQKFIEVEQSYR